LKKITDIIAQIESYFTTLKKCGFHPVLPRNYGETEENVLAMIAFVAEQEGVKNITYTKEDLNAVEWLLGRIYSSNLMLNEDNRLVSEKKIRPKDICNAFFPVKEYSLDGVDPSVVLYKFNMENKLFNYQIINVETIYKTSFLGLKRKISGYQIWYLR